MICIRSSTGPKCLVHGRPHGAGDAERDADDRREDDRHGHQGERRHRARPHDGDPVGAAVRDLKHAERRDHQRGEERRPPRADEPGDDGRDDEHSDPRHPVEEIDHPVRRVVQQVGEPADHVVQEEVRLLVVGDPVAHPVEPVRDAAAEHPVGREAAVEAARRDADHADHSCPGERQHVAPQQCLPAVGEGATAGERVCACLARFRRGRRGHRGGLRPARPDRRRTRAPRERRARRDRRGRARPSGGRAHRRARRSRRRRRSAPSSRR